MEELGYIKMLQLYGIKETELNHTAKALIKNAKNMSNMIAMHKKNDNNTDKMEEKLNDYDESIQGLIVDHAGLLTPKEYKLKKEGKLTPKEEKEAKENNKEVIDEIESDKTSTKKGYATYVDFVFQ